MVIGESKTIDNNIYVEADKKLKNSKTGELFSARTIAYKHTNKNRFTAFVTNIPKDNMNSTEIEKQIKDSELKIKQTENDIEQALEKRIGL